MKATLLLLFLEAMPLSLAGCAVAVPLEGKTEIVLQQNPETTVNTLVTVGPKRLLDILTKQILKIAPKLEPVNALVFRDTAFPQGGWQLEHLLDPQQRNRIVQSLQVDYLVLISPLVYTVGDASGFFFPLVAGAQSAEHKSTLSATIYDLNSGSALCRIDVTSKGKERVLYYVVIFAATAPHAVTPTIEAMAKEIAKTIENVAKKDRIRFTVLAAEPASIENHRSPP